MKRRRLIVLKRASCHLVYSSSQAATSFCSCFFHTLGHSSGQIRVVWSLVGRPFTHLYLSGNNLFQSIPLKTTLVSHHSSYRSACVRLRYRFTSSHRRISLGWRRLFHLGCTALIDVLGDGHIQSHHSCSKSVYRFLPLFYILIRASHDGPFAAYGFRNIVVVRLVGAGTV